MNKINLYFHQLIVPFCIIIVFIMGKWYHAIPNELVKHPMFHSCDSKSMDRNMGWSSLGSQSWLDRSQICPAQIAILKQERQDRNLGRTKLRSQSGLDGSKIWPAWIAIAVWAGLNCDRNLGWTDLRSVQIAIWALTYIHMKNFMSTYQTSPQADT